MSIRSNHLLSVSEALGIPVESLVRPLPAVGGEDEGEALRATFLWDHLYPDLDDFAIAINRWEHAAVGRLVQVSGLYAAERLLGRAVWKKFDLYKHHIHPARRQRLEDLVKWHERPTSK